MTVGGPVLICDEDDDGYSMLPGLEQMNLLPRWLPAALRDLGQGLRNILHDERKSD